MNKKGFTIIELLVVLAAIGLILRLTVSSYTNVGKISRDGKRKSDLESLKTALEQYRSVNGSYPSTSLSWQGTCPAYNNGGAITDTGSSGYVPNLAPEFIQRLPHDPREGRQKPPCSSDGNNVCYIYKSDSKQYKIVSFCGIESLNPTTIVNDPFYDPVRNVSTNLSFQVSSSESARISW